MENKPVVDLNWLCNWLEENSSGIYRPAKEAAHVIRSMSAEIESLRAQLKAAHAQEPVGKVRKVAHGGPHAFQMYDNLPIGESEVYVAAPISAQQSPAVVVPDKETNFCALKSITDAEVNAVARAFWRRIYAYRNDYGIELPKPLPVEFMAHMATALTWVDREPSPRITEQDARDIAISFYYYRTNQSKNTIESFKLWLNCEGRALLNKLNGKRE